MTILVTGGTGTFGKAFARHYIEHVPKETVRVFSRSEYLQMEMRKEFGNDRLRFLVGDVRDRARLVRAMEGVDTVIHAAALKQVDTCEYNPIEAVKTNVDGSANVIEAALDAEVERVICLSTDKAVSPVNLYGATKLTMERLMIQANAYGGHTTMFSCVRYGNVIGSRGSIVPLFEAWHDQGRPLKITHPEMTRFWLTVEAAAVFVFDMLKVMRGGEVFVPKLQSTRIVDLAEVIDPGGPREIVGIRPGEKLHETLITAEEASRTFEISGEPPFYMVLPDFLPDRWASTRRYAKAMPAEFTYSSGDRPGSLEGVRKLFTRVVRSKRIG